MSQSEDAQLRRQTCEECGTELVSVQVAFEDADFSEGLTGVPVVRDVCPNPDCPRHDADLLALSGERPDAEGDRPGSLGGDNGGA